MSTTTSWPTEAPAPHYWTLDEYHRAIDAGVFGDRRVELLHGEVVEMPPMNEPHVGAVRYLSGLFFARLGWQRACSQTPITLPSDGPAESLARPNFFVPELYWSHYQPPCFDRARTVARAPRQGTNTIAVRSREPANLSHIAPHSGMAPSATVAPISETIRRNVRRQLRN